MLNALLNPKKLDQLLDPASISFTNEFYILENLNARLLSLDEKANYRLELASSIKEISSVEYEIGIKDCGFSNGEMIVAKDVQLSLQRSMRLGTSHAELKNLVKEISVLNNKTLKIILNQPSKSFFYYLSLPDLGVLHRSQYEKNSLYASDFTKVSSGPFFYSKEGEDYFLIKNKNYSLAETSYPSKVKLINYFDKDPFVLVTNGEADIGKISLDSFLRNRMAILSNEELKVIGVPTSSTTYLVFNPKAKNEIDEASKKWIKKKILENFKVVNLYKGIAEKSSQYFPPESKAYLSESEVKEAAMDILNSKPPTTLPTTLTVHTYTTAYKVTVQNLVESLESIEGLNIKVVADIKPDELQQRLNSGEIDIFLNIMSTDFRVPVEAINYEFFSKNSLFKDRNDLVHKAFLKYQTSKSESEEIENLKIISRYLVGSSQFIPLFHSVIPYVFNMNKVDVSKLNHLFIFNFWRIKSL